MISNVYLTFDGNCAEAFRFYERVLGGKLVALLSARGSPMEPHIPKEALDQIMHARLELDGQFIMGSDALGRYEKPQGFSSHLGIADPKQADRVFAALAEGGTVTMPIQETFWALRFGMLVDRFGVPWMVNCERPANQG